MPPITSSRPGARLRRIGREKSNSADNSARTRSSRRGTGSRLSRGGGGAGCAWLGTLRLLWLIVPRRGLRLHNHPVEKSSSVGQLEDRREHVGAVNSDLRK